MLRTRHALAIPSIAALLANLAAGCIEGGSTYSSGSGQCGEEVNEVYPLDASQLAQLEAGSGPGACMDLCSAFSSFGPISCSWAALPDGGSFTSNASVADGSTSSDGSSTGAGASTGGASTGDASTGDASTGDASTGDASTGEASTDTSTGDASTGEASTDTSTGEASTSDATTSGDVPITSGEPPTTFGGTGFEGAAGELHCVVWEECVGGRGHAALQPAARPTSADALDEWIAAMAHSEAASVVAFHAIADELLAHGAPDELVRRAREAADDERRHAETMGTLARRRGVEPAEPRFAALEIRELEALARENAVEGCVRETWAALEACCQARRARDPQLREAMEVISVDESRHAQLSWDLDAWARTRLSSEAVARIDAARREAVHELERMIARPRPALLHARAGIPEPAVARELLAELRRALWS